MARAFALLFFVLLAFLGGGNVFLPFSSNELTVLFGLWSLFFLSINLPGWSWRDGGPSPISVMTALLFLFYVWGAAGYFYSVRPEVSFGPAVKYLTAVLLGLALVLYLKDTNQVREILWTCLICSGLISLFAVVQQFRPDLILTRAETGLSSHSLFFNVNLFSCYLLFHLPLGAFLFFSSGSKKLKALAVAVFISILVGLLFSGSPGGQTAAILQLIALSGYLLWEKRVDRLRLLGLGVLLASLCYAVLLFILPQEGGSAASGMAAPGGLVRRGWVWDHMLNRFDYWRGAWRIFLDHWAAGTGPWTIFLMYPQYGVKYAPLHAHNLFMQTAADAGLIGLVLLSASLWVLYKKCFRVFLDEKDPDRDLAFYLTVAVTGFLLHNLVEYNWITSSFTYYFTVWALLIDFLDRKRAPRAAAISGFRRFFPLFAVGCGVVGAVACARLYLYDRAIYHDAMNVRDIKDIETFAERAKGFCQRCDFPYLAMAAVDIERFKRGEGSGFLLKAEGRIQDALRLAPYNPEAAIYLGEIRILQNRYAEARELLLQAKKFNAYTDSPLVARERLEDLERKAGLPDGR
ncbi:MAG: O-antigen ligase family protein [Nitrospinae bacterium]|nr:O-antigen ligase family protein [Nitrospinota bacterium]